MRTRRHAPSQAVRLQLAAHKLPNMVKLTDRRRLGKSSVTLPPLGFGCAPIGETPSPPRLCHSSNTRIL